MLAPASAAVWRANMFPVAAVSLDAVRLGRTPAAAPAFKREGDER